MGVMICSRSSSLRLKVTCSVMPPVWPETGHLHVGPTRGLSDRCHYDKSAVCGAYDPMQAPRADNNADRYRSSRFLQAAASRTTSFAERPAAGFDWLSMGVPPLIARILPSGGSCQCIFFWGENIANWHPRSPEKPRQKLPPTTTPVPPSRNFHPARTASPSGSLAPGTFR